MQSRHSSDLDGKGHPFLTNTLAPRLRLYGLYKLPDGGEAVVGAGASGRQYFLYHPLVWQGAAWVLSMPVAYVVDGQGRIQSGKGAETSWVADDLVDTGETLRR